MNPKIHKLRTEIAKNEAKMKALQERTEPLREELKSLENTEIIGLIRTMNLDVDSVYALILGLQPAPVTTNIKEEKPDEI